jgi:hypothetical protein
MIVHQRFYICCTCQEQSESLFCRVFNSCVTLSRVVIVCTIVFDINSFVMETVFCEPGTEILNTA